VQLRRRQLTARPAVRPTAWIRTRDDRRLRPAAQAAGVLCDDVKADDLSRVFEQIASVHGSTPERTDQLRAPT
jgi:hypothetical protein